MCESHDSGTVCSEFSASCISFEGARHKVEGWIHLAGIEFSDVILWTQW
jgi:hypothetical protein